MAELVILHKELLHEARGTALRSGQAWTQGLGLRTLGRLRFLMPEQIVVAWINEEWVVARRDQPIATRSSLMDAIPIAVRLAAILSRSITVEVVVHRSSTDFYTVWRSDRDALSA